MKPLNFESLRKAYLVLVAHFSLLVALSLLCLFFYFHTKAIDYRLIGQQFEHLRRQETIRREIDAEMEKVQEKFNWLSQFRKLSPEEMDDQYNTLASVRESNARVRHLLEGMDPKSNSYRLYWKLTNELSTLTGTQDSLFSTRFQIASIKEQLAACLRTHRLAEEKLSKGIFKK